MNQPLYTAVVRLIPEDVTPQIDDDLDRLGKVYNGEPDPLALNFDEPILKYAYIYRYFVCIANAVRECWSMLTAQENVDFVDYFRGNTELNVCCVGGGPGTDLVGFCRFLETNNVRIKLNATILDKHDWSAEAKKLIANIDGSDVYGIANFDYVKYDLFENPIRPAVIAKIKSADIVTVVKFLSAVVDDYTGFQQFEDLLCHLKPNARLFFMDNSGGPSKGRMYSAARNAGLKFVCEEIHSPINVSKAEADLMASFHFGSSPQKSTTVSASLWIKA